MRKIEKCGIITVAAFAFITLLTGCDNSGKNDVTAIPFKSDEDGKWGMISTKGEVIFENEFRNVPTYVTNGRFFVQNQDGFWELYTAEKNPKRLGEEMRYVSPYSDGVAMVTPRNKPITIINEKGEEVASLEKFENHTVTRATPFTKGRAVVSCDTLKGAVDSKGKTVIQPIYSQLELLDNGRMIAAGYDFTSTHLYKYDDSIPTKGKQILLDANGKELYSMDGSKYWTMVKEAITDKYITLKQRKITKKTEGTGKDAFTYNDVEMIYTVVDYEGKVVVAPRKEINQILAISDDYFIYTNRDNLVGVMTMDGKTVVKPEYNGINFIGTEYIAVEKYGTESNNWTPTFRLLDNTGQPFLHNTFTGVAGNITYRALSGNNIFAREAEHDWLVFDDKGVKIPDLPTIYEMVPYSSGDPELMTDKINYEKFIADLRITPNSLGGYNFSMYPRAALEEQQKQWNWDSDMKSRPKAADYTWMQDIYIYGDTDGLFYSGEVHFPQTLSKQTYRQEKVIDYTWGDTYWYHWENIPTGYEFNTITPSYFKLTFSHWNYYGKLRDLYKALTAYCAKWGKVNDSNPGATFMTLDNGKKLLIALSEEEVMMKWGNLTADDSWIGQYNSNSEKLESTYDGNIYFINYVNNSCSTDDCDEEGD